MNWAQETKASLSESLDVIVEPSEESSPGQAREHSNRELAMGPWRSFSGLSSRRKELWGLSTFRRVSPRLFWKIMPIRLEPDGGEFMLQSLTSLPKAHSTPCCWRRRERRSGPSRPLVAVSKRVAESGEMTLERDTGFPEEVGLAPGWLWG